MQDPAVACPFDDADHCQTFEDVTEFTISDRSVGFSGQVAADDFTPEGTSLSGVCVWGLYFDYEAPEQPDCSPAIISDHFRVRVFDNDPVTGRVPRNLIGESMAASQRSIIPGTAISSQYDTEVYSYQLTLASAITDLTPGQVYWLEVSNDVSDSVQSCKWSWMRKTPTSSSLSFVGDESGYHPTFEVAAEQAFCLNVEITPSTIGSLNGPCCTCDSNCSLRTLYDCGADNGLWDVTETTCDSMTCSTVQPNDHCVDGPPFITSGAYLANNRCATTDGYGPIPSDTGGSQIESDLWYYYISEGGCQLEISECSSGLGFDSMLAVYNHCGADLTGCDHTICPPCPLDAATTADTLAGIGQDDSCSPAVISDHGLWMSQVELGRDALPGECFLIRVGSYPGGGSGLGRLDINCAVCRGCFGAEPVVADAGDKTRFLSFTIPSNELCMTLGGPFPCCTGPGMGGCNFGGESAIRIVLQQLHIVNPPYSGGPTTSFSAFEGQHVYVGPPMQFVESNTDQIPFLASFTTCTPHYRDWTTVGLLHVTGAHIVPSSVYQVERLIAICEGNEVSPACQTGGAGVSPPVEIRTRRWGDVAQPHNPPSPTVQPDLADVSQLVNKFRGLPGAPMKAQALLAGNNSYGDFGIAGIQTDFSFVHIAVCVDAFRGAPYPHRMGKCAGVATPPASGACTSNADCSGANGQEPCLLYCP